MCLHDVVTNILLNMVANFETLLYNQVYVSNKSYKLISYASPFNTALVAKVGVEVCLFLQIKACEH